MREISVVVAYALPDQQRLVELRLPAAATAGEAIQRSGLLQEFPSLSDIQDRIGIHGRRCSWSTVLNDGDRVEIYRALDEDVKARRQQRVAAARRKRPGGR